MNDSNQLNLNSFKDFPVLASRIRSVFDSLPSEVQDDFLNDACFRVSLDYFTASEGRIVVMPLLNNQGTSRCVVLKPRLEKCSNAFSTYIIAHEFAHAFLHNGGWNEITDVEDAADALAAHWGYPKQPFERVGP